MGNNIFVGIDLSYKSTGITIYNQHKNEMLFYRIVTGKPKPLSKVNVIAYDIPYNFRFTNKVTDAFTLSEKNKSLKSIMCVRTILRCIDNYIKTLPKDISYNICFGLEAHLMPVINGKNQFQGLSGLIGLNYILREHLIMFGYKNNISVDLCILSPSEIKRIFADNGRADKVMMFEAFMNKFEGKKLLGSINAIQHLSDYNDIIDSFAICYATIYRNLYNADVVIKNTIEKEKRKKVRKSKKVTKDIWELSL